MGRPGPSSDRRGRRAWRRTTPRIKKRRRPRPGICWPGCVGVFFFCGNRNPSGPASSW